ncbi:hypothetical protein QFC19_006781 [Naganishia cerealis]|uniref:Uncharacterized protein n=1 Tax=Naganishia cerealis TaxID=610337 RepID=A0ACC2VEZ2_9TREE|nr:hypothetical protein QFC19_006781 [Naganishia cerealis]
MGNAVAKPELGVTRELQHASNYGPIKVDCKSDTVWLRKANSLSLSEQSYIDQRAVHLDSAWESQVQRLNLSRPSRTPVVAMALSGGGYRAMLSGSGMAFGLDSEDEGNSVGDVLGLSSYVSGLSGGSWAVGSFYANEGRPPKELVDEVWHLQDHLVAPIKFGSFYAHIVEEVDHKRDQSFEVQITDAWALALTDHRK